MSRTTMYAAPEGGTFAKVAEFQNSWGSAMYVWHALGAKYCGDGCFVMFHADEFWPIWKDRRLAECERVAMLFTFDRCLVRATDAGRLAAALREFVAMHPPGQGACSLPKQAKVLDGLASKVDFTPYAIGWNQTSVVQNRWGWRHTGPGEDEGVRYDLSKDADHFWLFEELERFQGGGEVGDL